MPEQVVTQNGQVVYTRDDIEVGRSVWQSIGGQQNGSIWGHGALIAPDWSAEWLHLEVMAMLELRARSEFGLAYDALQDSEQVKLQAEIRPEIRRNPYDPATGSLAISDERPQAIAPVGAHYLSGFSNDSTEKRRGENEGVRS